MSYFIRLLFALFLSACVFAAVRGFIEQPHLAIAISSLLGLGTWIYLVSKLEE